MPRHARAEDQQRPSRPARRRRVVLYAWVRQENGTTIVQQALETGGLPLVDTRLEHLNRPGILKQVQQLADVHGVPLKLIEVREIDTVKVVLPSHAKPWRIISLLLPLLLGCAA